MADTQSISETVEVVFSAAAIAEGIDTMARRIAAAGLDDLLVVAVLKGSYVFAADLLRALYRAGLAPQVDFLSLSSYRTGTTSSGRVAIVRDIEIDVAGRNVLIVDDILESLRQGPRCRARGGAGAHLRAARQAGAARGRDHSRLQRVRMSEGIRGRLRHGPGAPLPRTAVRRSRGAGRAIGSGQ
jgi:hypothetical protein